MDKMGKNSAADGRTLQRYYGYEAKELKLLFLDIEYRAEMIGNTDSQEHSFYEESVMYLRKNEKEWYLFGTADE
ncbi:MAG: hypothetical protein HFH64_14885 [Lachnospiraceae bacterium]|nr:hypothetical protein [Lachnospiraceae bacterium]